MDGIGAVVSFSHHLHLHLGGLDGIAHTNHLTELAVTGEVGVRRYQYIAQIPAGIDVTVTRVAGHGEALNLLNAIGNKYGEEVVTITQAVTDTEGDGIDILHHAGVFQALHIVAGGGVHVHGGEKRAEAECRFATLTTYG